MVNRLAASSPELDAGVAYYGRQVPAAQVPNIKAALPCTTRRATRR